MHRALWTPALIGLLLIAGFDATPAWSWGSAVHRLVNRSAVMHIPPECTWFAERIGTLESRSTDADRRKGSDPNEGPRHYIDIDDYPEFLEGTLPHAYEEMVATYGARRVHSNGTLPWVIASNVDLLVEHLIDEDWEAAVAIAADIGHYAADLHSPLHLTTNYDGQLSGQRGIHSRHESQLTGRYLSELAPAPDSALALPDPLERVFDWIDVQYPGVALILEADRVASAGGSSGQDYYALLWDAVGAETRAWMQNASVAVASLWYTAWLRANGLLIPDQSVTPTAVAVRPLILHPVAPNPFNPSTQIHFELSTPAPVRLTIHTLDGRLVRTLLDGSIPLTGGTVTWGGLDHDGTPMASGVYFIRLRQGDLIARQKAVLLR